MTEGTRLGEFKETHEFKTAVQHEPATGGATELRPTKIGEMSDFEKNLYGEVKEVKQEQAEEIKPIVEQPKQEKKLSREMSFQDEMEHMVFDYHEGDIIKGIVRSIEKSGVLVDIKYKSDGFILNSEFSNDPSISPSDVLKPGDEVQAFIEKLESKEGYTVLSRKRAEYENAWGHITKLAKTRDSVAVLVTSKVEGGLVAEYNGVKGFIPASQVLKDAQDSLDQFLGKKLEVAVLKSDRRRRKVIFSHKLSKTKVQKEDAQKLFDSIEVGQVREGVVTSVKDFGVFVDLGGMEGLVHISEMSWSRVTHPSELVKPGDNVKVFILGVDKESRKISLGMKQLETDPWVNVAQKYSIGQIVAGTITRIVSFGAFIQLEANLEGLIHISELSYTHVDRVEDAVKVGDVVQARVIKLIPDEQKIGLSLKGVKEAEATTADAAQ